MPDDIAKKKAEADAKILDEVRKRGEARAAALAKKFEDAAEAGETLPPLHVIPCGMWSYTLPQTPALESMIPPTDEADPNFEPPAPDQQEAEGEAKLPSAAARAEARQQPHRPQAHQ